MHGRSVVVIASPTAPQHLRDALSADEFVYADSIVRVEERLRW
jgi:hypothetical protein